MTHARRDPRREAVPADVAVELAAHVESSDGRVECTLYPLNADADELVTTWMTAANDSFVDLENWR